MKKYPIFIVLMVVISMICFSTASCSDKKPAADSTAIDTNYVDTTSVDTLESIIAETPMPKAADELFDDFIFNFAANRKLQLNRITFPIVVNNENGVKTISKVEWKMEHFFMRQEYYTLIFDNKKRMDIVKDTTVKHVVIEKISLTNETVKQFVFNRIEGKWMLTSIKNEAISKNPNASFLQFYQQFSTDSAFQVHSLNDLVEFSSPDPDDDFNTLTGSIVPEQWSSFKPGLIPSKEIYNIIYGQKYTNSNQKVFVVRGIANGLEEILVFRKKDGAWKLMEFNG